MMAAYIDLNPVRAGIVTDPRDYRWSGYGAACAGMEWAKQGIDRVFEADPAEDLRTTEPKMAMSPQGRTNYLSIIRIR